MNLFSSFSSLFTQRQEQLEKQEKIDEKLLLLVKKCPKKVSKYLLKQRELNRDLTEEYNNVSFTSYLSLINKHILITNEELRKIEQVKNCNNLKELLYYKNAERSEERN